MATTEGTPFKRFFARLDGVVSSTKDGVGRMLVRGVPRSSSGGGDGSDGDADAADAQDEATQAKYTDEDMAHMRFIVITKGRAEQLNAGRHILLGEQADEDMMSFDTSFSYQVMGAYGAFARALRSAPSAAARFDALLGFTANLAEYDAWVHDHEVGWGGHRFLADLARQWRDVLAQDDATLGCAEGDEEEGGDGDGEGGVSTFTRPGVLHLLDEFQATVEAIEQVDEPAVRFRFRACDFDAAAEQQEEYGYEPPEAGEGEGEQQQQQEEEEEEEGEEVKMRALMAHLQGGGRLEDFLAKVTAAKAEAALRAAPALAQPRLRALLENVKLREAVAEEKRAAVEALEARFRLLVAPIEASRTGLVDGSTAVQGEAADAAAAAAAAAIEVVEEAAEEADESNPSRAGVPGFWRDAIANHPMLGSQLGPRDGAALSYCTDVGVVEKDGGRGFVLTFTFGGTTTGGDQDQDDADANPNPFFSNGSLTKDYDLVRESADAQPSLRDLKGTAIAWRDAAHNLCERVVKKKQKSKARKGKPAATRVVTVTEKTPSFFQFFAPPALPDEGDDELSEEAMDELQVLTN